jgi:chromatin structure-remodeling complex subunit RSC1/2
VKDCAQVFHNAKTYNRPGSQIYRQAEQLEDVLIDELDRLVMAGELKQEDAKLPDLGPLPPASPELLPAKPEKEDELSASEPEEFEESASEASEGSDDDEDEELDKKKRRNSGSGRGRRGNRRGSSQPRAIRRRASREVKEEDGEDEPSSSKKARDDPRRKRGRPPRVDTPVETRIKNILKALRKLKDKDGITRMISFEKLPEKKEFPEYFEEIKKPIALDLVRVCIRSI